MNIDIAIRAGAEHQRGFGEMIRAGLARHGIGARMIGAGDSASAQIVATWGWRNAQRFKAAGKTVLVVERGFISNRFEWTSLGWGGLNGRALWPSIDDGGERFDRLFEPLMRPWREVRADGLAVIMGQCATDAACAHIRIADWYAAAAKVMRARGFNVAFRPHPLSKDAAPDLPRLDGTLDRALGLADLVVTFNSNSGVDAVMAGVPTIACDIGSMALPVAALGLDAPLQTPDRTEWASRMAWRQWDRGELARGDWVEPVFAAKPN